MGIVYEAYDLERDTRIAIKTILDVDASTLYRFKKEFRSITDINHPNLVKIHELVMTDEYCFYTMEFIDGVDFIRYVCPEVAPSPENPLSDTLETYVTLEPTHATGGIYRSGSETEPWSRPSSAPLDPMAETEGGPAAPASATVEADRDPDSSARSTWPSSSGSLPGAVPIRDEGSSHDSSATNPGDKLVGDGTTDEAIPFHELRLRSALRQLAEALNVLHLSGRLHRDIKPSNVLVARRGRLVVLDFGLSTELEGQEAHQSTTDGHVVGTAAYMAPEQAAGEATAPASDWYSVGVMLYRALTGQPPFFGRSLEVMLQKRTTDPTPPKERNPTVPDDLNDLCMDLLRRDPSDRPVGEEVVRRLGGATTAVGMGPSSRARLFVGRDRQLAQLEEAFTSVGRGKAGAVFVHGRSGAGKSTLLQRFLEGLVDRSEAVVLGGRCYEQESVAYKAIDTVIDSLTRFLRRLHRHEAEGLMPRDVTALARVFPVLRRVDAVAEAPNRSAEIQDPQELRRRAFGALREMLARIGDRKPMVLAIDDMQWGDVDSASLLCELLRPPDPPLLLLVCAYRSEYATQSPCLRMLLDPEVSGLGVESRQEVVVDALSLDESRELALRLLGQDDELAQFQSKMIARESRGSPYFVYELVEHLGAGGDLGDRSSIRGEISLDDVLWERIRRLPDAPRVILEALAVSGRPLGQADTIRAAELGPEGFAVLGSLRSAHLIRGTGSGAMDDIETYHDRIRETIVNRLSPARLKHWHERLAVSLEQSGHGDAQTLAVHFDAAGQHEKAADLYIQGARQASQALAFETAARLFRRAMEIRQGTDQEHSLRCDLARALASAGRTPEAAREYELACQSAGPDEILELRRALGFQLLLSGRIDEGTAVYRDLLALQGVKMPATPNQLLRQMVFNRLYLKFRGYLFRERRAEEIPPEVLLRLDTAQAVAMGTGVVDWIRGSSFQSRSLMLALSAGEPVRVARAMGWEVVQLACIGRKAFKRCDDLIVRSRELADRLGDPRAIGMTRLGHGAAHYLSARFQSGATILDEATAILRDRCPGAIWELDTSQMFAAWALFYSGEVAELRTRCPLIAKEGRERGDTYLEVTVNQFPRITAQLADDDPEQARHMSTESMAKWSQQGFHVQHLTWFFGQMLIDLYENKGESAWQRTTASWGELEASLMMEIQHVLIDAVQYRGRGALAAARAGGPTAPLVKQAERAAKLLKNQRLTWADGHAASIRAGIASIRGDQETTITELRKAVDGFDRGGLALYAAAARRMLGRLVGGDEGRALIARSDEWMAAQEIRCPEKMARACVSGLPEP